MIGTNAKTFGRRQWKIMLFLDALPQFTSKGKSIVCLAEVLRSGTKPVGIKLIGLNIFPKFTITSRSV